MMRRELDARKEDEGRRRHDARKESKTKYGIVQ
jgi:hypothetical protein